MSAVTSREVKLEAGVAEFLKRHGAEGEFQTTHELVCACFPELRALGAYLQEDPDEDERQQVIFHVSLPRSQPLDVVQEQRHRFYEQLVERCPPSRFPDRVCGLMIGFTRE